MTSKKVHFHLKKSFFDLPTRWRPVSSFSQPGNHRSQWLPWRQAFILIRWKKNTKHFAFYHIVILLLKLGSNKWVYKTRIHLSKTTRHFGAKIIQANSTLEMSPPPLFLDPVSRSGSDPILYYLKRSLRCK